MKIITSAAWVGALALASTSAFAANSTGNFFINAGIGQSQYHVGHTDGLGYKLDEKDTAGALRFGYAWHVAPTFDLGVEGGYVDLGKLVASYHYENAAGDYVVDEHADLNATGWLAGVIVKGHGFGLVGNIVVGIIGAFLAGWLLPMVGLAIGGGIVAAIINALIGAVILLFLIGLFKRAT